VWDNNGGYNYTLCSFAYRHPKKPQYGWKWSAPNVLFFEGGGILESKCKLGEGKYGDGCWLHKRLYLDE